MADVGASVLAKIKNKAKSIGVSYQQCLQLFCQEEFLRRLSKSGYADNLILKGGLLIYVLTNFESRATIDMDFLLHNHSSLLADVETIINGILNTKTENDFIELTARGFEEISPQRKYRGVSVQITGKIKNVRVPFNVDIGVGDVIVPKAERRFFTTQLADFDAPEIYTYSLESTIAEKFDAILQRFELTGRMKDFYDIYYLASFFDFNGEQLQTAIEKTLHNRSVIYRKENFSRIVTLADDTDMQSKWRYFTKSIKNNTLSLQMVIGLMEAFLRPVCDAIADDRNWQKQWYCESRLWK